MLTAAFKSASGTPQKNSCVVKPPVSQCSDFSGKQADCTAKAANGCKWDDTVKDNGCSNGDDQAKALADKDVCKILGGSSGSGTADDKTCTAACSNHELKKVALVDVEKLYYKNAAQKTGSNKIDVYYQAGKLSCAGTLAYQPNAQPAAGYVLNGKCGEDTDANNDVATDTDFDKLQKKFNIVTKASALACTDNDGAKEGCAVKDGTCVEERVKNKLCSEENADDCPKRCKPGKAAGAGAACEFTDGDKKSTLEKVDCQLTTAKTGCQFKVGDKTFTRGAYNIPVDEFDKICVFKVKCSGTWTDASSFVATQQSCHDLLTKLAADDAALTKQGNDATPELQKTVLVEVAQVQICKNTFCPTGQTPTAECKTFSAAANEVVPASDKS